MLTMQLMCGGVYTIINITIASLFVGMGLYFKACHQYFAAKIDEMGEIVDGSQVIGKKDDLKLKRMLVESIGIHNEARAYVSLTQFEFQNLIDSNLFWSQSLRIVSTNNERHGFLPTGRWHSIHGHIELRIGNSELQPASPLVAWTHFEDIFQVIKSLSIRRVLVFFSTNTLVLSTGTVFLYCHIGALTTDQFHNFGESSYDSLWYRFPMHLQQFCRLIIGDAQRERVFTGFGIIELNLTTFSKESVIS